MTRYLTLDDILRQVDRAGFVVHDPGLLASALARPGTTVFGEDAYPSVWLKAAAMCQSLDNNQALVDGNKRLAWLSTKVFLKIDGQQLDATVAQGERFMLGMVAGRSELHPIADWLQNHSTTAEAAELPDDPA